MEYWTPVLEAIEDVQRVAAAREDEGWDCLVFADTQYLYADPYVMMSAAAVATTRIKVSHAATNPASRDISVTAAAVTAVHQLSGGRAILGMGRGDSALFYLGQAPVTSDVLEAALAKLRELLAGRAVPIPAISSGHAEAGHRPSSASLRWRADSLPPVPINLFATGPKTIRLGALLADRLTLAVGADCARIREAVRTAQHEASRACRPGELLIGADVAIAPHRDVDVARGLIAGKAASQARFSAMSGRAIDSINRHDAPMIERVSKSYDMSRHAQGGTSQTSVMSSEFLDRFAIAGPPELCIERLESLLGAGLSHLILSTPGRYQAGSARDESIRLLATEVLPAIRMAGAV